MSAPLLSSAGRPLPAAAVRLIERFRMERIPNEGCWFAPTFRSDEQLGPGQLASRYAGQRSTYNAIFCVMTRDDFSGLHRLATDELWHFYDGSPLDLVLLHPDGRGETVRLGRDLAAGETPQHCVPRGVWQGARPAGAADAWTFIGNSMAPAFDYADFEIGWREELQAQYPGFAAQIAALTRPEHHRRPTA